MRFIALVPANKERAYFVSREEIHAVLDASPDHEWRLLVALARFAGVRVPSEPLSMRWSDIDWDRRRIRVPSPKTAHHENGKERFIPFFPELEPFLMESHQLAEDKTGHLITRYQSSGVNLRTQLLKIIGRAGLSPWPRLWQNMRASRETELVEQFPAHVVAAWIGHSVTVAEKNDLQVTDEHFAKAVQNPVQHLHAPGGTGSERGRFHGRKRHSEVPPGSRMGVTGLARCDASHFSATGSVPCELPRGAESGAAFSGIEWLCDVWDSLPLGTQHRILSLASRDTAEV